MLSGPMVPSGVMWDIKRVIKTGGGYSVTNGIWVDGEEEAELFKGSIWPVTTEDLKFDTSGTYTVQNMKLYTYEQFTPGQEIIDKNQRYKIFTEMGYSPFAANLNRYVLERMGVSKQ